MTGKNSLLLLFILCNSVFSFGRQQHNEKLRRELLAMYKNDQLYRENMAMQPGHKRDSIAGKLGISPDEVNEHFSRLQHVLDSANLRKTERIFSLYGYPGKSLVGEPANEAAYYVIQHSDRIAQYFPLIEKAGENKELSFLLVAMMQDRLLKSQGEEQLYGTQYAGCAAKDSITNQQKIDWFLWPVRDYAHLNERRIKAGFKETIQEDAESQGIPLRVITIKDAKKYYPGFFVESKK